MVGFQVVYGTLVVSQLPETLRLSLFGLETRLSVMSLNRNVSHSSCNTGALLQVADGKSGLTG